MATGLSQAHEALKNVHTRRTEALSGDRSLGIRLHLSLQCLVEHALLGCEITVHKPLNFGGQVFRHIRLQSTQQKGVNFLSQPAHEAGTSRTTGPEGRLKAFPESGMGTQIARHQEIHQGPQIKDRVFHGGTGQHQLLVRLKFFGRFGVLGSGILDVLGFVQGHDRPGLAFGFFQIPAHNAVTHHDQPLIRHLRPKRSPLGTPQSQYLQIGGEPLCLLHPVFDQRRWAHQERR